MPLWMRIKVICFFILIHQAAFASKADSLLNLVRQTDNALQKSDLYIKIGDAFEYSDPSQALYYYQKAYETAHSVSLKTSGQSLSPDADLLMAKSLRYRGIILSDQGNFDDALESYFQSKTILDNLHILYTSPFKDQILLKNAKLLNNIGVVYSRQGVFGIAKDYYLQALESYIELSDSTSIAVAYSSLGIVEARMANLTDALEYFHQALDIYTFLQSREGMAQSYNNIGGIHFQMSNWDEALKLYSRAHDIFSDMKYVQRIAATRNNIGLVYRHKQEYNKALESFNKSLEQRLEINDRVGIVESYNSLGELFEEINDFAKASEYYTKSFQMASSIGDQRMISLSLISIGKVFFNRGQITNAIYSTLEGLELARNHALKFSEQLALKQLADYYAASGDYKKGFEYSTAHHELSQQILDEQKTRQINELQIGLRAREKQQRIELLEQEHVFQQEKIKQSSTIALVLALLFLTGLMIALFIFLLLRQRNNILMLKKENEAKKNIQKADNDLKAILKTHAHGMILFDNELNINGFNAKADYWFREFIGMSLEDVKSVRLIENPLIHELMADAIGSSLKGNSVELEKEIYLKGDKVFFKFYSNPVFENNDDMIQSVSLMIENITERRTSEEKIMSDLNEKETLIKEIHHRVKNNMQVIISLIRMQSRHIKEEKHIESFRELEQRMAAMAYVHEDLYKSPNLVDIKFDDYIQKITSNIRGAYGSNIRINNHIEMQRYFLSIDMAMSCGLIINELVTNVYKHAFSFNNSKDHVDKKVEVFFYENPLNYELRVVDNGNGLREGFELRHQSHMGFNLIKIIAEDQLHGSWNIQNNNGLKVSVVFPKKQG